MKFIANSIAASGLLAVLAVALAAPVSAQTPTPRVSVPFDFGDGRASGGS
jgi:hypothetical protein